MADAKKIDPFDVEALEKSLNDSATRVSTIWISFLIFSLYLLIATSTVDHRQLLLAEPVKLPVLSIDLPLSGFFFLVPILFVIFHLYVLLQVLLLGRTAAAYNNAIDRTVKPPTSNAVMRQRLANALFAQIFAGSPSEREGWLGWLLKTMAWITLVIAPILILLAFQLAFLPYHSHLATWTHRLLIFLELATALLLWPIVLDKQRNFGWRQWVFLSISSLLLFSLSMFLATFPGEPHINLITGQPLDTAQCDRQFSVVVDRLTLRDIRVVDDEKLAKMTQATADRGLPAYRGERTRNFSGRDLNCSYFLGADLRRVDLSDARLSGANLLFVVLEGATLDGTQLQNANLDGANLRGASLAETLLQGAYLGRTQLQGAHFSNANLRGAVLDNSQLQGAILDSVQFQGASLSNTRLQGAYVYNSGLEGASLDGAQAQGASFDDVQFQGASLVSAQLQGAVFRARDFQWISRMAHADLSKTYVWRTKGAECRGARVSEHKSDAIIDVRPASWSAQAAPQEIERFIERSTAGIPDAPNRNVARDRMRAGLNANALTDDTAQIAEFWRNCENASMKTTLDEFKRELALYLRDLACKARDDRKAIADGIVRNWIPEAPSDPKFSGQLALGLLGGDGGECAASKDLEEPTTEYLRDIVAWAAKPAADAGDPPTSPYGPRSKTPVPFPPPLR